ncbi:hypothetical protein MKW94_021259 [Papaver nudicaule]|uniref:Photosystem II 5 kDa protein, chloroplastic n=1 Tax=Papaver nudicaule TaxID=74823 RepID=A0AA41VEX8_PAPNU|nr:hypothetical protein [Papaver nudicaule]
MASLTMTTVSLSGINLSGKQSTNSRRGLIVAKASNASEAVPTNLSCNSNKKESTNARREIMFAAAAAAVCSLAGVAFADEPKNGSAEAKKAYAPVCVTMPTARVCRN